MKEELINIENMIKRHDLLTKYSVVKKCLEKIKQVKYSGGSIEDAEKELFDILYDIKGGIYV